MLLRKFLIVSHDSVVLCARDPKQTASALCARAFHSGVHASESQAAASEISKLGCP